MIKLKIINNFFIYYCCCYDNNKIKKNFKIVREMAYIHVHFELGDVLHAG